MNLALTYFESGDCIAVGEVGRPHFPVEDEIWNAANQMLHEILHRCSKYSCPVQSCRDRADTTFSEIEKIVVLQVFQLALFDIMHLKCHRIFRSGLPVTVSMGKESIQGIVSSLIEDDIFFKT